MNNISNKISVFSLLKPLRSSPRTRKYMLENTHVYMPSRIVLDQLPGDVLTRFPRRYGHLAIVFPVPAGRVRVQSGWRGVRDPRIGHYSGGFACIQTSEPYQLWIKSLAMTFSDGGGHKNVFLYLKIVCALNFRMCQTGTYGVCTRNEVVFVLSL